MNPAMFTHYTGKSANAGSNSFVSQCNLPPVNNPHTFTTRLVESGTNIKVIQDILGHADISTTLNIYADAIKDLKKREFANLEAWFQAS